MMLSSYFEEWRVVSVRCPIVRLSHYKTADPAPENLPVPGYGETCPRVPPDFADSNIFIETLKFRGTQGQRKCFI